MIEVCPQLFVGNGDDFEDIKGEEGWAILQCAKEPWHRAAVGYTGRGAPKESPEYFYAYRDNRLILNMVDALWPHFFSSIMVNEGLDFIQKSRVEKQRGRPRLKMNPRVLVHCNLGNSRAPSMALLYMRRAGIVSTNYDEALEHFKFIYPAYEPGRGIGEYVKSAFDVGLELRSATA